MGGLLLRIQHLIRPTRAANDVDHRVDVVADLEPAAPATLGHRVLGLVSATVQRFLDVSGSERRAAASDLDRVRGLLRDAVATLQSAFTALDRTSRAQNADLTSIISKLSTDAEGDGGGEGRGDSEISIRDFVKKTETTLQYFTDLLAQISKQSIEASYKMDDMVVALDEMFALVGRVDEVADRTNMLALNASITAAQAGEAGKAFGVVAAEVKSLSRASKDLNSSINQQVVVTRNTIEQARNIVREMASKDLIVALQAKDHVDAMLRKLVALDQRLSTALESVGTAAQDISGGVDSAVRALQFEDIVSQVLAHVQVRLERIDPLASVIQSALAPRDAESSDAVTDRLLEAAAELDEVVEANDERRHVEQSSMSAGDVELF